MPAKVEHYSITKTSTGKSVHNKVQATYGFLDVRSLGIFPLLKSARDYCKEHARQAGQSKPIILT